MEELRTYIEKVRKRQTAVSLFSGLWLAGQLLLIAIFLAIGIEAIGNLSSLGRTILFFILLGCATFIVVWYVLKPLAIHLNILRGESDEQIAERIGSYFPQIRDKFLDVYQLSCHISELAATTSPELIAASINSFLQEISGLNLLQAVDEKPIRKMKKRFFITLGSVAFIFLLLPSTFIDSAHRLVHFQREFSSPPPFTFFILPGNKEVVKGDTVDISISLQPQSNMFNGLPHSISLVIQQEHQEYPEERILQSDSAGIFRTKLYALRGTTTYEARWRELKSERYTLTVLDRPLLRSFRVKLDYPSYTHLPTSTQDEFVGDIMAYPGTTVYVEGSASKLLSKAMIHFNDGSQTTALVNGYSFKGKFVVRNNGAYSISLQDENMLGSIDPVWYQIRTMSDEFPTVIIAEPGRNIDIADNRMAPLRILAKDDFGISALRIGYRLIASRFEQPQEKYSYISIPISSSTTTLDIPYVWQLTSLHLVPEDVVEYFAEVYDNDVVSGPKSGKSELYLLRLPSLEEVFADVENEHEQSFESLTKAQAEAEALKKEIDELDRELKKNKDPDWQLQKKTEEVAKRYEELQKKLDETRQQIEKMSEQMEQQNVLSQETLEKYNELQQLFQQINSDELRRLLQQMQRPLQTLDKQQMQQLIEQLVMNEERFRQSIERTIELLKRLQIEQKLDELVKRTSELQKQQEDISRDLVKARDDQQRDSLSEQQSELKKEVQALEQEMESLQKRMEEFFTEMPADKMGELLQKIREDQLSEQMEQSARDIQSGNIKDAQKQQSQIQQSLQTIRQQLEAMQKNMRENQSAYVMSELRRATYNLLELSKKQEKLQQESKDAPYGSPQLRTNAQEQAELQQSLHNLLQSLQDLSKKSFVITPEMSAALGEASRRMETAIQYLEDRSGQPASRQQAQAMEALNLAATQFQKAIESMMQQGGGGGGMSLFQQLQQMASQQMALNLETQEMGKSVAQQGKEKLAQQQEGLRKSLEELMKEAQESVEHQRLARELSQIEEEMKEVVRQLESNDVSTETIQKQERILSRLLDASRSMRERDYEQRRRSETATSNVQRQSPEWDPTRIQSRDRFLDEIFKAQELRYAKEYQELIKIYFDALEKEEKPVH